MVREILYTVSRQLGGQVVSTILCQLLTLLTFILLLDLVTLLLSIEQYLHRMITESFTARNKAVVGEKRIE